MDMDPDLIMEQIVQQTEDFEMVIPSIETKPHTLISQVRI